MTDPFRLSIYTWSLDFKIFIGISGTLVQDFCSSHRDLGRIDTQNKFLCKSAQSISSWLIHKHEIQLLDALSLTTSKFKKKLGLRNLPYPFRTTNSIALGSSATISTTSNPSETVLTATNVSRTSKSIIVLRNVSDVFRSLYWNKI